MSIESGRHSNRLDRASTAHGAVYFLDTRSHCIISDEGRFIRNTRVLNQYLLQGVHVSENDDYLRTCTCLVHARQHATFINNGWISLSSGLLSNRGRFANGMY